MIDKVWYLLWCRKGGQGFSFGWLLLFFETPLTRHHRAGRAGTLNDGWGWPVNTVEVGFLGCFTKNHHSFDSSSLAMVHSFLFTISVCSCPFILIWTISVVSEPFLTKTILQLPRNDHHENHPLFTNKNWRTVFSYLILTIDATIPIYWKWVTLSVRCCSSPLRRPICIHRDIFGWTHLVDPEFQPFTLSGQMHKRRYSFHTAMPKIWEWFMTGSMI